jgi:hypothetical protein
MHTVLEGKHLVEKTAGRELTASEWKRLRPDASFEAMLYGTSRPDECADQLEAWAKEAAVDRDAGESGAITPAEIAHARALTAAVYDRATQAEEVLEFRARHLASLVTVEGIPGWVRSTRRRDGGPPFAGPLLRYPGDGEQRAMSTAAGGVLNELAGLAEGLADRFTWQPAQAVAFVLADAVPIVGVLRATTTHRAGLPVYITVRASAEMSPESVYRAFVQERDKIEGRRYRPLNVNVWEAVEFAAFRSSLTWRSLRMRWSDDGRSRYPTDRSFARAVRTGLDRLGLVRD